MHYAETAGPERKLHPEPTKGIIERGDSEDTVNDKCGNPLKVLKPDPQEPVGFTILVLHNSIIG